MKPTTIFVIAALASATSCCAEITEMDVRSSLTYGYSLENRSTIQGELVMAPSIEIAFSPGIQVILSGRVRWDSSDLLEPGEPESSIWSRASRPFTFGDSGLAELRDAYVELELKNGFIRFGKQQVVLGKLDGVRVLDVVNPHNFREFILDEFDQSRISQWSIYVDKSFGDWRTELVWAPDATGDATPGQGAWFELTAPRFRFGANANQGLLSVEVDRDGNDIADGAIGFRLSRLLGKFDVGAIAYSGLDHESLGRIVMPNDEATLERFYKRRDVFGVHAETSAGALTLRMELALQPSRSFNSRTPEALDVVSLDQRTVALAADINGPLDIFVNLQYVTDWVSDAPATLVRPKRDRIVTAYLRRSFAYETATLELRTYYSLEDGDSLLTTSVGYEINDSTRVKLSADSFSGARDGVFGQFSDQDRVTLRLEHIF